ncbi:MULTISPECIES: SRPBCC family protein [unclassified Microbulbifer]|uniref:SRPBCC family protein n=1 Tax=unclassified Microbulbifer TaxID=2619833 RepID=UPI001E65416B|nr:SRPBCC family protein [Microbulbifer sp. YPW16]UHQ55096.1 SRPBCC family protein [Microbulbifer sp. YPW16]
MRWILYIIGLLVLLVLAGFLFPREVTVERSVYINKPPAAIFPTLNNLRNFNNWSPWYSIDPTTDYIYSGPGEGVGNKMSWSSENPNVGRGSQTIIDSQTNSMVRTHLDFGAQGTAMAELQLEPQGSGTNVTWNFNSDMGSGPIARWMGLVVKNMVGESYERGLNKLKNYIESSADTPEAAAGSEAEVDSGSDEALTPESGPDSGMEVDPGDMDGDMETEIIQEESEEAVEENRHGR